MRIFDAEVVAVEAATPTIKLLKLVIEDPDFRFLPGQWVELTVNTADGSHTSGFSVTTSPTRRGWIELAVKKSARQHVSGWVHDRACPGDRVQVSQGQGPFVFLPEMSDNLVLIGGGVGVTPLLSIFRHVRDAGLPTRTHLLYSASEPAEFLCREELEAASAQYPNLSVTLTVTQAHADWAGATGRIDLARLNALDMPADTLYYLCGPQGMVEDVAALLHASGVPMSRIIFEKWW